MKSKVLVWAASAIAVLVLAAGIAALAQDPRPPVHLSGIINDYTPATINGVVSGPWEVHGVWSLRLKGSSGKADFSAALTMEHSDEGVALAGGSFDNPKTRNAHTHHITMEDADVILNTPTEIQVSGPATITGNGAFPPPFGGTSSILVDITGGTGPNSVQFSNVALTFTGDAQNHFGPNPIHGAVRNPE